MLDRAALMHFFTDKRSYMEDRVNDGIETNRKGQFFLKFTDSNGNVLPGKKVRLKLKNHAFRYGGNIFMIDEFDSKEKNDIYKKLYADAFNMATVPFYWSDLEPEQGKPRFAADSPKIYRRPATDLCVDFCEANGIEPKAHCLNYAHFTPEWVPRDITGCKLALEKRFAELAERYKHRINMWEVTNETYWGGYENVPFYREPDFVEWSFRTAEKYFPANQLAINETNRRIWEYGWFYYDRSPYYMQIERALLKGCRIDSIAMQYHMFFRQEDVVEKGAYLYDPERIFDVLDCYAKLGRKIHISEVTIPAYEYSAEAEAMQAEIIRNLYRIWFSHPAMEAIMYWNLIDGFAFRAEPGDMTAGENYYHGGLIRYDFTAKPAYYAIRDLFEKEYTTDVTCETNSDGELYFKGFYGDYEFTVDDQKIGFALRENLHKHYTVKLSDAEMEK